MVHYKYLLVGGGMASDAAARGIREVDKAGTIGLIGIDPEPPYNRPPLSKGVWKGRPIERIFRRTDTLNVEMHLNHRVVHLDISGHLVRDDQNLEYTFEKLLLATGAAPIQLPNSPEGIMYYRSLADYRLLKQQLETTKIYLVIGGGYIGSELAAVLVNQGKKVTMVFPEIGIGARLFPNGITKFLNQFYREKGVEIASGRLVKSVVRNGNGYVVHSDQGDSWKVDGIIAGLGVRPEVDLATQIGLTIDNGILVNSFMETEAPNIFAAGDVITFPSSTLNHRYHAEHEENANLSGRLAGLAMAGQPEPYTTLPSMYSDLFELGYEAVGDLDPKLEIVEDWEDPYRKGVVYYLKENKVMGVLLWNIFGKLSEARMLIENKSALKPQDLKRRIKA